MKNIAVIFLVVLIFGCSGDSENSYLTEIKKEGGLFRGIELRDNYAKVTSVENEENLVVDEKVYLRYEYPIDKTDPDAGHYKVEYYFDGEDQLHEMIYDIFITDKSKSNHLYEDLRKQFDNAYGEAEKNHEGYLIWKGKTKNTNKLEIALLDDSKYTEGSGYISLQLNDFDY